MKRRPRNARRETPPPLPQAILTEAQRTGLMPIDYLLSVMRDTSAAPGRRDRAAICAAQYCHARAADYRVPKRDRQAAEARKAGADTEWETDLQFSDGRLRE